MASQPSKEQVATELNKLLSQGATEDQITAYIAKTGYKDDEFTYDLKGKILTWAQVDQASGLRIAGRDYNVMSKADQQNIEEYYRSLAASSTDTNRPPTNGNTTTTTTTIRQSSGGGVTTTYDLPAQDTAQSLVYKQEAKQAFELQSAYQTNPDSVIGRRSLDRKLQNGTITQEQYNEIVNSTPEQRIAKVQQYSQEYNTARDKEVAAQIVPPPQVVVTPEFASSEVRVDNQKTNAQSQAVPPTVEPVAEVAEDTAAQGNGQNDLGKSGKSEPEPVDEFGDLESAVDANSGLQEPPLLDEDELEAELGRAAEDARAAWDEPPAISDELTVPPGTDTEEEGRQPGLAEPVDAGVNEARNSGSPETSETVGVTGIKVAPDWRFRIQLARGATYLYKDQEPGILTPLKATDGVIYPYTPQVTVNYSANYETSDIAHSNFKIYNYRNSSVENISIVGDFTAQDTYEANYLLAVIHFFRSVTKMFYGKDENPARGLPPPLCYLTGHGDYAFSYHPVVITSFNMSWPNDVDYITATISEDGTGTTGSNVNLPAYVAPTVATPTPLQRLFGAKLSPGGLPPPRSPSQSNKTTVTRVPTKLTITLNALPVVTRYSYSNNFSLKDYATGRLLAGVGNKGGGIW